MTTVTFSRILQTGMSFLGVSIAITIITSLLISIGLVMIDTESGGQLAIGVLFIMSGIIVVIAGGIGIFQKLFSDAFLDGFITARDSKGPINEKKMGVLETLKSGFQVIGIVVLTMIISTIIVVIGVGIMEVLESDVGNVLASLFYGTACALILAVTIGMVTMILAEGVFSGAKNSGITFDNIMKSSFVQNTMVTENSEIFNTEEE
ncbi:hypothetical protein N8653_06720 [Euryarchaeota archaeon]|nr:hypothetical protein [Euryarchaeota archaeon]